MRTRLAVLAHTTWIWLLVVITAAAQESTLLTVRGARRTRFATVADLLPRPLPTVLSEAELAELERRVSNLGIFDQVGVAREDGALIVDVREKWTLIPSFELSTGDTLADLYIALGATEYNVAGTATALGVLVYRAERGFGFSASVGEHESRRHRWSYGGEASYGESSLRFDDAISWYDVGTELMVSTLSPAFFREHLRFRAALWYGHERITEVVGPVRPPSGHALQPGLALIWDAYRFHDLVPRGLRAYVGAGPGWFFPSGQARHWSELELTAALPLARYTVLMGHAAAALKNRGNANHNYLLGSISGVRGIPDSLYRNWIQAFGNVELRQAIPLLSRLALQLVAFTDAGVYERLDARGGRGASGSAFSGGLGVRVVPTFLTELLLRVDGARLVVPERAWFWQLGVSQYF